MNRRKTFLKIWLLAAVLCCLAFSGKAMAEGEEQEGSLDITIDGNGIATVTGTTTGPGEFKSLIAYYTSNEMYVVSDQLSGKSFTLTFDVKVLDYGYHYLEAVLTNGDYIEYKKLFPVVIYDTPVLKQSNFTSTWEEIHIICESAGTDKNWEFQMKKPGEDWSTLNTTYLENLDPDTAYTFRARYQAEFRTRVGPVIPINGPFSKEVTVRTAPKAKPALKSVTAARAKLKKVWTEDKYNSDGLLIEKKYKTTRTYCTLKIKFKKKPGIYGVMVTAVADPPDSTRHFKRYYLTNAFIKGNKKTYTLRISCPGDRIGKKIKVEFRLYYHRNYKAMSKPYKKIIKVRK